MEAYLRAEYPALDMTDVLMCVKMEIAIIDVSKNPLSKESI